ncbi:MAG: hypothetical protein NTX63_03170 [Candidatus Peregrinibacteria bacterium]|nr:hypothetical protein [Candidatus Peregrinibacteria bacterium]
MQTLTPGDHRDSPAEIPLVQQDVPFSFEALTTATDVESKAALEFATDIARRMGVKFDQFVSLLGDLADTFARDLKADYAAGVRPHLSAEKYSLVAARLRYLGWLRV